MPTIACVQQPGMTGQVKEDIKSRFFELGVLVQNGQMKIQPVMLRKEDFIRPTSFWLSEYENPYLSFTYCSTPFVYLQDGNQGIDFYFRDGKKEHSDDYSLSLDQSHMVFNRDLKILKIVVHLKTL